MPRRFIITLRAEEDYFEIWAYIAQDNIAAADRYRELPDRVELLRVLHGARDIPTLFEDF